MSEIADRMKQYESNSSYIAVSDILYIRLDGRGFSKFTKSMEHPYDKNLGRLMIDTCIYLTQKTNALIGYTQFDEISLILSKTDKSEFMFNGKFNKLLSVIASMATSFFVSKMTKHEDQNFVAHADKMPHFDCRVVEMPSLQEAVNMIVWRNLDCKRNSISAVAQHFFSHKQLQKVSTTEMIEMLKSINVFLDNYPEHFLYGTFIRKKLVEFESTVYDKSEVFYRTKYLEYQYKNFEAIENKLNFLFGDECTLKI